MKKAIVLGTVVLCMAGCGSSSKKTVVQELPVEQTSVFTSSDKAVNPTNVMGTSKLMGERLMSAAQIDCGNYGNTTFFSTRFGNVLGSHGSVFPLFAKQIRQGGPVTITDPDMTRFVMSTEDAVSLVMESLDLAHGGEVFVSRMPAIRITVLFSVHRFPGA